MRYTKESRGDCLAVAFEGELDLAAAPQVRQVLLDSLEAGQDLLVDLASVTFIDSSGLACLVEALREARDRTVGLALANVSAPVLQVLRLTRLEQVFEIRSDGG
jgi:anti-sigma B factor antagonist